MKLTSPALEMTRGASMDSPLDSVQKIIHQCVRAFDTQAERCEEKREFTVVGDVGLLDGDAVGGFDFDGAAVGD